MELYFKSQNNLNGGYTMSENKVFAICPYTPGPSVMGMCWEYDIIQKINKNEEGYFDFSKNLIDIGSEDGGYAMYCNFEQNYCFEPNKQMCCLIYTNMYLNDKVDNTFVYNVFLGDNQENVVFNGFSAKDTVNYDARFRLTQPIEMRKHLLDEYNIRNVGLIKTDTEGFDYFVLKGGINTIIENDYPPILFENWPIGYREGSDITWSKEEHDKLNSFLIKLGYDIIECWGAKDTHLAIKKEIIKLCI